MLGKMVASNFNKVTSRLESVDSHTEIMQWFRKEKKLYHKIAI
jgi:hypothetical protein